MSGLKIKGCSKALVGEIIVPGDKSISHRSIILSSISNGHSIIQNLLESDDVLRTIEAFKSMGVKINKDGDIFLVEGVGLRGLKKPKKPIDCGNSGTTARLISGILVGQDFESKLIGDESLSKRPMDRIIIPLSMMGASIKGHNNKYLPIYIKPAKNQLRSINYELPIASAQVKSAILLAALYARGKTTVIENRLTRDHTERMLKYFESNLYIKDNKIYMDSNVKLTGRQIYVPGDISSAAYFIVAATIIKGSDLLVKNVGINPTRTGIIKVLKNMGANISVVNNRIVNNEPIGDIHVKYSPLKAVNVNSKIIGTLIDEIPILAVAACFAEGTTIIRGAEDLKYKESNRLKTISLELKKMGAKIKEIDDGLIIEGVSKLESSELNSHNDHRIAMALSVAALTAEGESEILNHECVKISYPNFYDTLFSLNL